MDPEELKDLLNDPLKFYKLCWPNNKLYSKQVDICYSVRDNDETIVPAGNQLGKDYIAGFIAVWFFCSRSPCRVVTSSVDATQLEAVLWGEIRRFIQTSKYPLPIEVNHLYIHQINKDKQRDPISYLIGRVVKKGEGLLGHHVAKTDDGRPRTLALFDEASGIDESTYESVETWAHRKLVIGNPRPCQNFFRIGVKAGDLKSTQGDRYFRKVIKIRAIDSPNVEIPLKRVEKGLTPEEHIYIPGLISYSTYLKKRLLLDRVRQSWMLDGEFYEGAEVLLYPEEWLNRAERIDRDLLNSGVRRFAKSMGIDPGEGGDNTCWTIVDEYGIIMQRSEQTPDTSQIPIITLGLMSEYNISPEDVIFDRGGGGKQHADYMRRLGYNVRTIAFGEAATITPDSQKKPKFMGNTAKREEGELKYVYKNRRAEMFGLLRIAMTPYIAEPAEYQPPKEARNDGGFIIRKTVEGHMQQEWPKPHGFAIPASLVELRRQLAPLPLLYDPEGRLYLPPKDKKDKDSKEITLREMLGCSPDEADSTVLAVFGLFNKMRVRVLQAC